MTTVIQTQEIETRVGTLEFTHDFANGYPTAETVGQTARGIAPRLRVIAQKTWGSPLPAADHAGFERLWRRIRP